MDSGQLPPGLSLASDGRVSGTPTHPGTWSFWVSINDDPTDKPWCNPLSAEREFSIKIVNRLVIGPESLGPGTVGVPYSLAMTATLPDPKTWSISAGALPPGVTLGVRDGVISGTPMAAGSYSFTVRAVIDPSRSDTKSLAIIVRDPLTISAPSVFGSSTHLARSEVSVAFSTTLSATGGTGTNTWSLAGGTLPSGLVLSATGAIAGTPTTAGSYRFTVSVADDEGRRASYDALISVAPKLAITTQLLRPAKVGRRYRAKLGASGGVNPKRWRITGALPRGVGFAPATGIFAGTPRKAGRYRVTVEVMDALQVRSTRTLTLVVSA